MESEILWSVGVLGCIRIVTSWCRIDSSWKIPIPISGRVDVLSIRFPVSAEARYKAVEGSVRSAL